MNYSEKDFDTRAISIDYIAKTQEEANLIEEELNYNLEDELDDANLDIEENEDLDISSQYDTYKLEDDSLLDEDYKDAFDNVVYLDELGIDEFNLEDETEEIYPGIRKLKPKTEEEE